MCDRQKNCKNDFLLQLFRHIQSSIFEMMEVIKYGKVQVIQSEIGSKNDAPESFVV
jgi:hypothetical protein